MGDWQDPALYPVYWTDQLDLRLRDVLPHALRLQLLAQPGPVPHRLVRGVTLHPDVDHPRHPHQQNPVHPKLGQLAAYPHLRDHRCGRRLADGLAPGEHPRVCPAPAALLGVPGRHAAGLCDSDTGGEELVYSQIWRMMAAAGGWRLIDKRPVPLLDADILPRPLALPWLWGRNRLAKIGRTSW